MTEVIFLCAELSISLRGRCVYDGGDSEVSLRGRVR